MIIALVSNSFSSHEGGATAIAFEQAKLLAELGHQVFIFASSDSADDTGWREENNLKVYRVLTKKMRWLTRSYLCLRNFRIEKEFKKFLAEAKPDVIHFHNLYFQFPFSLLKIAHRATSKVFFTAHDVMTFSYSKLNHFVDQKYSLANIDTVDYYLSLRQQFKQSKKAFNPLRNLVIRHYLKFTAKIFSVSDELKKALEQNKIKNIATIHNSIEVNDWQVGESEAKKFKKELGLEHKKIILFAGRLSGYKGTQETIVAMEQVAKKIPEAMLLVLDTQNNSRQINPNIYLAGAVARDRMKYYYAICDLAIVPSVCFDSFPTVNLEAMACRKPVIATIFGGGRELVENNKTGYLVNPLQIDELAEKIIYLLTNPDIAESIGEGGFQKVKAEFNHDKWIKEILKWYI